MQMPSEPISSCLLVCVDQGMGDPHLRAFPTSLNVFFSGISVSYQWKRTREVAFAWIWRVTYPFWPGCCTVTS